MKLEWQIKNAISAGHFLLGTKRGRQVLSNHELLREFLQGKANGTLSAGNVLIKAPHATGKYLALKTPTSTGAISSGHPYLYELPEFENNKSTDFSPDTAVSMWKYEHQLLCNPTAMQGLEERGYVRKSEAILTNSDTFWRTPAYEITPKGNGLIRLKETDKPDELNLLLA